MQAFNSVTIIQLFIFGRVTEINQVVAIICNLHFGSLDVVFVPSIFLMNSYFQDMINAEIDPMVVVTAALFATSGTQLIWTS